MSLITFYKPNPKVTGSVAGFSCRVHDNHKVYQFYLNIARQVSWDAKTRTARFRSEDSNNDIAIKFNAVELAGIIRALSSKENFSTVHKFQDTTTSISMKWFKREKGAPLFSISISRGGQKYGIGLSANESYVLSRFCDDSIIKLCQDKVE